MTLFLVSLNGRDLGNRSRAIHVARHLRSLSVDVAAVQDTHSVSHSGDSVLSAGEYFHVFSAYGDSKSRGVSLLVRCGLGAVTNVVYAGASGRLIVADVAVRSNKFRVIAAYAPNSS